MGTKNPTSVSRSKPVILTTITLQNPEDINKDNCFLLMQDIIYKLPEDYTVIEDQIIITSVLYTNLKPL
jgi:hypothetical protein